MFGYKLPWDRGKVLGKDFFFQLKRAGKSSNGVDSYLSAGRNPCRCGDRFFIPKGASQ